MCGGVRLCMHVHACETETGGAKTGANNGLKLGGGGGGGQVVYACETETGGAKTGAQ